MTDTDRPRFAELLAGLAAVFNAEMSDVRAELYFAALNDLSLDQVTSAVELAIDCGRFFPVPSELRDWGRGRDPRLMDAARKRGWNPEAAGFLPGYDGGGAPAMGSAASRGLSLPAPERLQIEEQPKDLLPLAQCREVLAQVTQKAVQIDELSVARRKAVLREQARRLKATE